MSDATRKKLVVFAVVLAVAGLHLFSPARQAAGPWRDLYYSYFSDIVLPFSFYFLLCAVEIQAPRLRRWWVKAALVFAAASAAEILQFFGLYALGATFDPLDIAMYATGVLLAAFVERGLFARWLSFWAASQS